MKYTFALFFIILFSLNSYAQNDHEFVKLSEEKKGKRLNLYVENTDSISYDVFLKVETKDFRRSSNRPILRTIDAKTKVKILTLIQLANTEGNYNSTFIVNEVAYKLEMNKDFEALSFKLDKALKDTKVTIFTQNDCIICPDAKVILDRNKIGFTEYNIDKDSTYYNKIIEEFKALKPISTINRIPILKVDGKVYNNIETLQDFIDSLRMAFQ